MEKQWNLIISSLQDICNTNVAMNRDDLQFKGSGLKEVGEEKLQKKLNICNEHLECVRRAQRSTDSVRESVKAIITIMEQAQGREGLSTENAPNALPSVPNSEGKFAKMEVTDHVTTPKSKEAMETDSSAAQLQESQQPQFQQAVRPSGRSGWISQYNPNGPISVGSEVAFKPKKGGEGEWFQCVVVKVSSDGLRFEVRDPEPDELGNPGKTFKCNWRDIIFITPETIDQKIRAPNYPSGTKVLARYPETTTFYPAVVIGTKRDGTCRLKFDGEEEVDKETEVLRRLVLPCPSISSTMAKK